MVASFDRNAIKWLSLLTEKKATIKTRWRLRDKGPVLQQD